MATVYLSGSLIIELSLLSFHSIQSTPRDIGDTFEGSATFQVQFIRETFSCITFRRISPYQRNLPLRCLSFKHRLYIILPFLPFFTPRNNSISSLLLIIFTLSYFIRKNCSNNNTIWQLTSSNYEITILLYKLFSSLLTINC